MTEVIDFAKRLADKVKAIAFDEMSDAEFYALEEKFCEEKTRRQYKNDYPKEVSFRSFCARVKREFMHKLVLSQRRSVERICNEAPPPTLREVLEDARLHREYCRERHPESSYYSFWLGDWCLRPWRSREVAHWVLIWQRVRDNWGPTEPGTFEHVMEHCGDEWEERRA